MGAGQSAADIASALRDPNWVKENGPQLDLFERRFKPEEWRTILGAVAASTIVAIMLRETDIGDEEVRLLAPTLGRIHYFNFSDNRRIGNSSASCFARAALQMPAGSQALDINLDMTGVDKSGLEELADAQAAGAPIDRVMACHLRVRREEDWEEFVDEARERAADAAEAEARKRADAAAEKKRQENVTAAAVKEAVRVAEAKAAKEKAGVVAAAEAEARKRADAAAEKKRQEEEAMDAAVKQAVRVAEEKAAEEKAAAIAAAKAEAQQEMEKQAAATKSAAAAAANQAIVDDMCSDPAWAQTLQELHDKQPVVGLKEALTPTFALFRQNYAADYGDWTDQHFLDNIDQSIANMGTKLKDLGISDQYDVELAAGINIYTKQFPAWYWLMNDEFNNTNARGQGGGKGKSKGKGSASLRVQACIPFSKFLMNALQKLPEQFIHRAGCMRGIKWVFKNPLEHDVDAHFPEGKQVVMYSWKSATTNVEKIHSLENFCVRRGTRTIFKFNKGCIGYKISQFSEYPDEEEILMPILARFIVKSTAQLCHVEIGPNDTVDTVKEHSFKNSPANPFHDFVA